MNLMNLLKKEKISTLSKLRFLLSKREKTRWAFVVFFGFWMALLELLTAFSIAVFAQILIDPSLFSKYFFWLGMEQESEARKVLSAATCIFVVYLFKNLFALLEAWFQNCSIQKMNYGVRTRLLAHYLEWDYEFMLFSSACSVYRGVVPSGKKSYLSSFLQMG